MKKTADSALVTDHATSAPPLWPRSVTVRARERERERSRPRERNGDNERVRNYVPLWTIVSSKRNVLLTRDKKHFKEEESLLLTGINYHPAGSRILFPGTKKRPV